MLGSPLDQALLTALAIGWCACDAACFRLALAAAGVSVSTPVFMLGYAATMLATLVPLLPGGFGAVEAIVPTLLHRAGVPLARGLAAVLTYRLLATLMPALAGMAALAMLRRSSRRRENDTEPRRRSIWPDRASDAVDPH